ncbi:hypothetical protein [Brachyspira catarrhinii]|uniref:Glycosyltransferase n=1 Tax=Brachyspira catarrhinii TaxID=2528966 RepID=A0ABY2TSQ2_9SPIR|nr:hypothetical protein [Brachyspira catarrhinii]TKZ35791.1 hypothetical protein EZH24_03430 [Brachyspira catarrhinii]
MKINNFFNFSESDSEIIFILLGFRITIKKNKENIILYIINLFLFNKLINKLKKINNDKTILIIEANYYHGETLVSYAKYLLDIGYNIQFILNKNLEKENPFCRFNSNNVYVNYIYMSKPFLKMFLNNNFLSNYKLIFISTDWVYIDHDPFVIHKNIPHTIKNKTIIIEHDAKNFAKENEENIIKENRLFTLLPRSYKEYTTKMINPNYFGEIKKTNNLNKNTIVFIAVGVIHKGYKGHYVLEATIKKLLECNIRNFRIDIVGYGDFEIDDSIKDYIRFKGRLGFEELYSSIELSQYLLFLLDPNNEEHNRYLNENVSGALQLSLGFSIIPLIDEKFSETFGLNKNNSIIYKNNDLFSAMVKAINMNQNSYISLQNELTSLQMKYREESIDNIKNYLQYLE